MNIYNQSHQNEQPDYDHFRKQRKSLLLISSLLLLENFLGIQYKSFSVLNSGFFVNKTENIHFVLVAIWFYFLIRYLNAWYEIPETFKNPIRNKFQLYQREFCIIRFKQKHKVSKNTSINDLQSHSKHKILKPRYYLYKDNNAYESVKIFLTTPRMHIFYYLIKAKIYYIFKTHYFFEYYFPIVFALLPVGLFFYD